MNKNIEISKWTKYNMSIFFSVMFLSLILTFLSLFNTTIPNPIINDTLDTVDVNWIEELKLEEELEEELKLELE